MGRQIIVTGGSGFIGSAICLALADAGHVVHVWTRGKAGSVQLQGTGTIIKHQVDIYDVETVRSILAETPIHEMIHLAWGGLPNYNSCHHIDHELVHQIRFVRTAIENGVTRLTQAGTCFEYGACNGALSEDMECNPTNPYGYAKLALLRYVAFLQNEMPFQYKWARLFYMYGEGQGAKSLYTLLREAHTRGDPVFDMSAGHQIRDFSAVSEITDKIVALHDATEAADGVYNICSGRPVSVRQLVETWAQEMGYDVQLNLGKYPIPTYEPLAFWGTSEKTRAALANINA